MLWHPMVPLGRKRTATKIGSVVENMEQRMTLTDSPELFTQNKTIRAKFLEFDAMAR